MKHYMKFLFCFALSMPSLTFAQKPEIYIDGILGNNFIQLTEKSFVPLKVDPGLIIGAGLGIKYFDFRYELEFTYRKNNYEEGCFIGKNTFLDYGKMEKYSCFLNLFYDFSFDFFMPFTKP